MQAMPCIFRRNGILLSKLLMANTNAINSPMLSTLPREKSPMHFMQQALLVSFCLCKAFQISHLCLYRLQTASQLSAVEQNHRVRNALHDSCSRTHTKTLKLSLFLPSRETHLFIPMATARMEKMPMMSKREMACQKSAIFVYCVRLGTQCYFVSHGQVNLAKHAVGISIRA